MMARVPCLENHHSKKQYKAVNMEKQVGNKVTIQNILSSTWSGNLVDTMSLEPKCCPGPEITEISLAASLTRSMQYM